MSQITPLTLYDRVAHAAMTGDLTTTGAKLALLADTYTPSAAHALWSEVSAHEIAATTGYAAGGPSIGGTVTAGVWDADDVTFALLDATFAYGVVYAGTDLIGWIEFNGGDAITIAGYDFLVRWSVAGIVKAEVV